MRTIYETLDGSRFSELADAKKHEELILEKVKMWNWGKESTTNTTQARVIHLIGEHAGAYFKAMVKANPEEYEEINDDLIDDEDNGWFYWDEYAETYRYIDNEIVDLFIAANHQI